MHTIIKVVAAFALIAVTGIVTGRWFFLEKGVPFSINRQLLRNRFFWLGVLVGLVFLFSDWHFARYMGLL